VRRTPSEEVTLVRGSERRGPTPSEEVNLFVVDAVRRVMNALAGERYERKKMQFMMLEHGTN
jgi:hypothetical protein